MVAIVVGDGLCVCVCVCFFSYRGLWLPQCGYGCGWWSDFFYYFNELFILF